MKNHKTSHIAAPYREYGIVGLIGSAGYSLLEILWRGFTHWTMAVTGGVVLMLLYHTNCKFRGVKLWKKCFAGAFIVTSVELIVGCVVNIILRWNVWDYSRQHCNVLGQICLLYSVLWFFLCIPVNFLCTYLEKQLSRRREPA